MDTLESLRRRRDLTRAVRQFFDARGYLEVETPALIDANAPEPNIEALPVPVRLNDNGVAPPNEGEVRYLRTSPELALKRLMSIGGERLYEIARVFRDADHDAMHRIEFTLLEWYRAGGSVHTLMDDCEELLRHCVDAMEAAPIVPGPGGACDLQAQAERLTVAAAFQRHAGLDIGPFLGGDAQGLWRAARAAGVSLPGWEAEGARRSFEDVFFAVFLSAVEPALGRERPTLLYEWPAPLAALARLAPDRPQIALRVELYAAGVELANGFDELTDPAEQRRRFAAATREREAAGRAPYPTPEPFLKALGDMPRTAGMALGLERLLMLLTGGGAIRPSALPWGI